MMGLKWAATSLLLWLFAQLVDCARLAKPGSTHPSFPMDAFAKPTFQLVFEDSNPISNRTALDLLRTYSHQAAADTGISEYQPDIQSESSEADQSPFQVYLHRTSATNLHLCSVPRPKAKPPTTLNVNESSLKDHRSRIIENSLKLLSPLKDTCLFYTMDWFTYSLCYGDAIKQFRALPLTVGGPTAPAMDPTQDSYVLGRWNDQIEDLKASESSTDLQTNQAPTSTRGTELMELVHFSSLGNSEGDQIKQEEASESRLEANIEGKGRYISQVWTDGTRCIINNELRSTEVQFHCSKTPAKDRISVIKEVTTCNYVVVVDTPRLCEEPALAQVEDEVRQVKCQPILSDEEMRQRQSAAATIEGNTKSSASLVKEKTTKEDGEAEEAAKRVQEGVKASIEKIVSQINDAAGGASATELGVIVGWDEEGKFMVTPKEQETGSNNIEQSGTTEESAAAASQAKDKLNFLLEKLLEMGGGIENAADGDVIMATIQDNGEILLDKSNIQSKKEIPPVEQQNQKEQQLKTPLKKAGTETKVEVAPVRTIQMTREKESLGQRAERFYKQQEAQKQREDEAAAKQQHVNRDRDEL